MGTYQFGYCWTHPLVLSGTIAPRKWVICYYFVIFISILQGLAQRVIWLFPYSPLRIFFKNFAGIQMPIQRWVWSNCDHQKILPKMPIEEMHGYRYVFKVIEIEKILVKYSWAKPSGKLSQ